MGSLATPRILPSHLHAFAPDQRPSTSTVRMLGSITSLRGDQATLESYNSETVTLIMNRDSHLALHSFYEVVGKVVNLTGGEGLGLKVLGTTECPKDSNGQGPDMKLYAEVVKMTHILPELFQSTEDGTSAY